MTTAPAIPATERAVLAKVDERTRSRRRASGAAFVVGIRTSDPSAWSGPTTHVLDSGWTLTVAPCGSVLAVLDALATWEPLGQAVLAVVTDVGEAELGDAVLARLDGEVLHDADRYTLLQSVLGTRTIDKRIQKDVWLVDALIDLAAEHKLRRQWGTDLSRRRALALVAEDRLGLDPEAADLPDLVLAFDDAAVRTRWRGRPAPERDGLRTFLVAVQGEASGVLCDLAIRRDEILADLLAIQAVTAAAGAPDSGSGAHVVFGRVTESRFGTTPHRGALAALADGAVVAVRRLPEPRAVAVLQRAEAMLDELGGSDLAVHSVVLPRGYTERLAAAAGDLTNERLEYAAKHDGYRLMAWRHDRLQAALRLRRWLATGPALGVAGVADGLRRHARELAWVDRALQQVQAGDPDERVRATLREAAHAVARVRADIDNAFARRLAAAPETPTDLLAVETFLARRIAPLVKQQADVLLVVVDGMSGAVAGGLTEHLAGQGWTETTADAAGERETVLAALPTETQYSRSSLLRGQLAQGRQDKEAREFPALGLWHGASVRLLHKAAVQGEPGWDINAALDEALALDSGHRVVAVVLNAVDDALGKGRASSEPSWVPADIPGLDGVLARARETGRFVVLVSDHGHVLENGSLSRPHIGGGARWRPDDGTVQPDEVLISGPRVLAEPGSVVLAAVEGLRYGKSAAGYHGGASLAEVAIPVIGLVPPGGEVPDGWTVRAGGAPYWWGAAPSAPLAEVATPARKATRRKPSISQEDALFETPAPVEPSAPAMVSRGQALIASSAFRDAYAGAATRSTPQPPVFAAVVDAVLATGGRAPAAVVASAAGQPAARVRGLVTVMSQILNRDSYPVIALVDQGRFVAVDRDLLDRQFSR